MIHVDLFLSYDLFVNYLLLWYNFFTFLQVL